RAPPRPSTLSLHGALPIYPARAVQVLAALRGLPGHLAADPAVPLDDLGDDVGEGARHDQALVLREPGVVRSRAVEQVVEKAEGRSEEHTSELQSRFEHVCR